MQERSHLLCKGGVHLFAESQRLGNHTGNKQCIADRCQLYEDHAIDKVRSEVLCKLNCEPCLSDATWSCQGKHVCSVASQQGKGMGAFLFTTNQPGRRKRETK